MATEIVVNLLAPFADLAGTKRTAIEASAPLRGEALLALLAARFPGLAPLVAESAAHEAPLLLVVNGRAAERTTMVNPGDEVLLCPQVSGG